MQLADTESLFGLLIPVLVNQYPKINHTSSKNLDGEKMLILYWAQADWESKMKTKTGTLALAQASISTLLSRLGQKFTHVKFSRNRRGKINITGHSMGGHGYQGST